MEDTDFKTDGCIEKILLFVLYFIIIILSKLIWTGLKFSVAESECKSVGNDCPAPIPSTKHEIWSVVSTSEMVYLTVLFIDHLVIFVYKTSRNECMEQSTKVLWSSHTVAADITIILHTSRKCPGMHAPTSKHCLRQDATLRVWESLTSIEWLLRKLNLI